MEKSLKILLNFCGVFQFTHTLPLPSPHKQRWKHVSRIFFPSFNFVYGGVGKTTENFEKDALFRDSLCTDNLFSPQIFTEERREWGGGGEGGGSVPKLFYEGAQKLEKVMNTIMNTEIMNTFPKTFVQIVVISITITFLPPMFASLYFYSFPNPPPPLPHFHCFPSTTTTITRNTTYRRNVVLCISLIINMKKQRRKIKNVVSPALIIQHANTNSDIICFIAKNCSLIFIC